MKELGQYLKTERVQNGVSLTEASEDLNLSTTLLENIESGNNRAFKDVYELREYVKKYAKYLGANVDKVTDEFNDFLFEKTSKISLDDIKDAQTKDGEDKKKVISPYTMDTKRKIVLWPFILAVGIIVFVCLIVYIIYSHIGNTPMRVDELFYISGRM